MSRASLSLLSSPTAPTDVADLARKDYVDDQVATRASTSDTRLSVKPYPPVALTDASTVATNAALGTHFRVTITASRALGAPTNPTDGQVCTWQVTASGGAFTLTPATGSSGTFAYGSDITAVSATVSGKTDYLQAVYSSSAARWHVIGYVKGY